MSEEPRLDLKIGIDGAACPAANTLKKRTLVADDRGDTSGRAAGQPAILFGKRQNLGTIVHSHDPSVERGAECGSFSALSTAFYPHDRSGMVRHNIRMKYDKLLSEIESRLEAIDLSERKACLKAGLKVDSVRQIKRGYAPKIATLNQLAPVLGIPPSVLIDLAGIPNTENLTSTALRLRHINVIGAVQAGIYRDAIEWPQEDQYPLTVPADPRFPGVNAFALLVRGESMNRYYPDGSHVVCVKYADIARPPRSGERVICVRASASGEFEATIKEYQVDEKGRHVLWPRSDSPEFQQPFILDNVTVTDGDAASAFAGHFADDGGQPPLHIFALVIQSVRTEPVG